MLTACWFYRGPGSALIVILFNNSFNLARRWNCLSFHFSIAGRVDSTVHSAVYVLSLFSSVISTFHTYISPQIQSKIGKCRHKDICDSIRRACPSKVGCFVSNLNFSSDTVVESGWKWTCPNSLLRFPPSPDLIPYFNGSLSFMIPSLNAFFRDSTFHISSVIASCHNIL